MGYALDVEYCSPEEGTIVIAWEYHGERNQQWSMKGDKIFSALNGMALDINDGLLEPFINIIIWPLNKVDDENQSWELEYVWSG